MLFKSLTKLSREVLKNWTIAACGNVKHVTKPGPQIWTSVVYPYSKIHHDNVRVSLQYGKKYLSSVSAAHNRPPVKLSQERFTCIVKARAR